MRKSLLRFTVTSATLAAFSGAAICIAAGTRQTIESDSGTATFLSGTNVPGIEVKGSSSALTARADVQTTPEGLAVEKVEATVPVKSLATGMKIRDEHMRKYIFATMAGEEPDLHFSAENASCAALSSSAPAQGFACKMAGTLSLRGVARPFAINLKVKEQGGSRSAFRVVGDGTVKLSDYGIAPPTQFGVKPLDEVSIHLDFTGREKMTERAGVGQ